MLSTAFKSVAVALICLAMSTAHSASPSIVLAKVLDSKTDPRDYLVSEKFDGVRAVWDGTTLRFRSGNIVRAPQWFLDRLPKTPLDGELWLHRGQFEKLSGIVRKTDPIDNEWREVRYLIFELPQGEGSFLERAARIEALVATAKFPQLVAVKQFRVADRAELQKKLDEVVKGGGEGLMLHLATAPYVSGRSDVLLKLKPLDDTEAVVVAHIPGKGKYRGQLGALRVEAPDGKRFNIGTGFSDAVRQHPPPIGTTVTFTHRGLTKTGLPRFASFLRVREKF